VTNQQVELSVEMVLRKGSCSGKVGNCTEPIAYIWIDKMTGGVHGLCVEDCATWRVQTAGIAALEPAQIREIR
jgi:hypothetical protein